MNSNSVIQLRNILSAAQSILIAIPENADDDTVGAALALHLTIQKLRKQSAIIAPHDVKVAQSHFFAIDKIKKELAGSNALVISFPYKEGSIETISKTIEGNKFNLIIEPRDGPLQFSTEDIEFNFGRGDYDTVFVMGAQRIEQLGAIYQKHGKVFSQKSLINIDKNRENTQFAQLNIVEEAPISQTLATIFRALRVPLDPDPASNLYTGMLSAQPNVDLATASPEMLEAIAFLVRSKAQVLSTSRREKLESPKVEAAPTAAKSSAPVAKQVLSDAPAAEEAPEDWLKPKIFSSRNN
jgi:nanoRNase/pAp phosphatase (c-di-AMP/oligoRNAs hydrolase)